MAKDLDLPAPTNEIGSSNSGAAESTGVGRSRTNVPIGGGPAKYMANFQYTNMKQQNRFMMFIGAMPAFFVRATSLPSIDNNPVVVDTINSDYKIKGKSRWQPINLTLYDPIFIQPGPNDKSEIGRGAPLSNGPSGAMRVYHWINEYHHQSGDSIGGRRSGRNATGEDLDGYMDRYKKTITIAYLDPTGPISYTGILQDKWVLHGAFCSSVNWGEVDVSSDDLVLIEIEVTYDWAELMPPGPPIGI